MLDALDAVYRGTLILRPHDVIRSYFGDMELLEPGVVPIQDWRPDEPIEPGPMANHGGVAAIG